MTGSGRTKQRAYLFFEAAAFFFLPFPNGLGGSADLGTLRTAFTASSKRWNACSPSIKSGLGRGLFIGFNKWTKNFYSDFLVPLL